MKHNRLLKQLPNLITLLNMLLGLTVLFIHGGERHRLTACVLILIAVFLDAIDGKVARFLNAESRLGKELDSFADFVSFGLAPMAIMLTHASIRNSGWMIYACFVLYAMAAAFRLARFNIGDFKDYFLGLPITASGFILIVVNLLLHYTTLLQHDSVITYIMILLCILAVLMVSKVKIQRITKSEKAAM